MARYEKPSLEGTLHNLTGQIDVGIDKILDNIVRKGTLSLFEIDC
jgi:hypothetical protein